MPLKLTVTYQQFLDYIIRTLLVDTSCKLMLTRELQACTVAELGPTMVAFGQSPRYISCDIKKQWLRPHSNRSWLHDILSGKLTSYPWLF